MIILGIDPALVNCGWGVIEANSGKFRFLASGVIRTKSSELMTSRLAKIASEFENILVKYSPDLVAMEETFVNNNALSSLKLGYARGAVMSVVGRHKLDFRELKPNLVKKTVVGVGHAEKAQVLHMVKLLIKGSVHITNFDESDALAVAYTAGVHS